MFKILKCCILKSIYYNIALFRVSKYNIDEINVNNFSKKHQTVVWHMDRQTDRERDIEIDEQRERERERERVDNKNPEQTAGYSN
jgi:hypothetical protein